MSPPHPSPPPTAEVRADLVRVHLLTVLHHWRPVFMGLCLFATPIPLILWALLHSTPPEPPPITPHPFDSCQTQLRVISRTLLTRPADLPVPSCESIDNLPHPGHARWLNWHQAQDNMRHLRSRDGWLVNAAWERQQRVVRAAYAEHARRVAQREWLAATTASVLLPLVLMLLVWLRIRRPELVIDASHVQLDGVRIRLDELVDVHCTPDQRLIIEGLDQTLATERLDESEATLRWLVEELRRAAAGRENAEAGRQAEPGIRQELGRVRGARLAR